MSEEFNLSIFDFEEGKVYSSKEVDNSVLYRRKNNIIEHKSLSAKLWGICGVWTRDEWFREVKQVKKIKMLCYLKNGCLFWAEKGHPEKIRWTRVPCEDKEIEVEI